MTKTLELAETLASAVALDGILDVVELDRNYAGGFEKGQQDFICRYAANALRTAIIIHDDGTLSEQSAGKQHLKTDMLQKMADLFNTVITDAFLQADFIDTLSQTQPAPAPGPPKMRG